VRTAATKTDNCGLLDAAVIAFFVLMEPMFPLPVSGIMPQSDPTRAAVADAVGLGLLGLLGLLVLGLLVLVPLGLGLPVLELRPALPLTTGPAPPVCVAEGSGALPQAVRANAMLAATAAP
jgi:hypothetical protein